MFKDTQDGQNHSCTHENSNTSGICDMCMEKVVEIKEQDKEDLWWVEELKSMILQQGNGVSMNTCIEFVKEIIEKEKRK